VIDDGGNLPLTGRSITIGSIHTTTDDAGRFSIPGAASTYDLVIVDPDGTTVSVYAGLTRRDPLVRHHRSLSDNRVPTHVATIAGTLSGDLTWPLSGDDTAGVLVVSPILRGQMLVGGRLAPFLRGPSFGPLRLGWDGAPSLQAEVYAWAHFADTTGAGFGGSTSWAFAERPVALQDGAVSLPVSLVTVSKKAHVTGTIDHPPSFPPTQRSVYYALPPRPGAAIGVGGDMLFTESFDFTVPVLPIPGGALCFSARSMPPDRASLATDTICAVVPGRPVSARLQSPPSLTSPKPETTVTPATQFEWTAFDGGVYELNLSSGQSAAATPNIHLYTAARSVTWPDLSAAAIAFPLDAAYTCTIAGLGPFASLDDLVGPAGSAAAFTPELRRSYLRGVRVQWSRQSGGN
jgi:hypothetical protein